MLTKAFIVLLVMLVFTSTKVLEKTINDNWTLTVVETPSQGSHIQGKELAVDLPTVLHLDLLKYGLIDDPFYRDNYLKMNWISDCNVKYSKKFNVDEEHLEKAVEIVFKGIDTYSTVSLNGNEILKT